MTKTLLMYEKNLEAPLSLVGPDYDPATFAKLEREFGLEGGTSYLF